MEDLMKNKLTKLDILKSYKKTKKREDLIISINDLVYLLTEINYSIKGKIHT
jgi:cytochrome b involved in lipid metabolism